MFRRMIVLLAAAGASLPLPLAAQTVKVGLINSYTGFVAQPADQGQKGFDLYVKLHEKDLPPGVKIELLRRDDTSNPEVGKRLAQELITRDHVQLLTGIVLSPVATAVAPLTAEAKVPLLLDIASAGVTIPRISPYVVRISFTLWQESYPIGKWAAEQGWKTGYSAVSDFIPGHDAEAAFTKAFTDGGGKMIGSVRFPPTNPDFSPFVQRIKDAKPDVVFIFVPAGTQATAMIKSMQDLGLREAGINVVAPQDLLPDEELPRMGDTPLGLITSGTPAPSTAPLPPTSRAPPPATPRSSASGGTGSTPIIGTAGTSSPTVGFASAGTDLAAVVSVMAAASIPIVGSASVIGSASGDITGSSDALRRPYEGELVHRGLAGLLRRTRRHQRVRSPAHTQAAGGLLLGLTPRDGPDHLRRGDDTRDFASFYRPPARFL